MCVNNLPRNLKRCVLECSKIQTDRKREGIFLTSSQFMETA